VPESRSSERSQNKKKQCNINASCEPKGVGCKTYLCNLECVLSNAATRGNPLRRLTLHLVWSSRFLWPRGSPAVLRTAGTGTSVWLFGGPGCHCTTRPTTLPSPPPAPSASPRGQGVQGVAGRAGCNVGSGVVPGPPKGHEEGKERESIVRRQQQGQPPLDCHCNRGDAMSCTMHASLNEGLQLCSSGSTQQEKDRPGLSSTWAKPTPYLSRTMTKRIIANADGDISKTPNETLRCFSLGRAPGAHES
jgi:hypothetical protein